MKTKPVRRGFKKLKCTSCGCVITYETYRGNDRCRDCQLVRVRNYENGLDYWLDKGLIKKLPNYIKPILYEEWYKNTQDKLEFVLDDRVEMEYEVFKWKVRTHVFGLMWSITVITMLLLIFKRII